MEAAVKTSIRERLDHEQTELWGLIAKGITSHPHARILVKADKGWKDKETALALNSSVAAIERIRQRFVKAS